MSCGFSSGTTSSSHALAPNIFIEHLMDARLWRTLPRRLCLSLITSELFYSPGNCRELTGGAADDTWPQNCEWRLSLETPDYFPVAIEQFCIYS